MAERETKKARRYVEEKADGLGESTYDRIILISDSKGKYLEPELVSLTSKQIPEITWQYLGGRNTKEGLQFLKRRITQYAQLKGKVLILFWYLTCDVTKKT